MAGGRVMEEMFEAAAAIYDRHVERATDEAHRCSACGDEYYRLAHGESWVHCACSAREGTDA
ncbi:MAG: hypothetical protein FJ399_23265 [Verrucomicrobia bacterium]|nr:hypothetical protein [Verrucomicrobiota bacterium]